LSTTHSEADDVARQLFTRMSADLNRMVKRADVDYDVKSTVAGTTSAGTTFNADPMGESEATGVNDQMAFYSEVDGYASGDDPQNTVSLVAYRINAQGGTATPLPFMERMGKALSWTASNATVIQPLVFEPQTIMAAWPAATDPTASDPDYEMIAANVFRFEYYYVLRSGATSSIPWDVSAGSTGINGFKDVTAIGVVIAVADRKAGTFATLGNLTGLATSLRNFAPSDGTTGVSTDKIGALELAWQSAVTGSSLAAAIRNGIHIYGRLFSIPQLSQ
jgi:hypothetical protein